MDNKSTEIGSYWIEKYEKDARKNWDLFYKRNSTHFYKDRHWLSNATSQDGFEFFNTLSTSSLHSLHILEVGCGVGNTLYPILQEYSEFIHTMHAFDFSSNAIQLLLQHQQYPEYHSQIHAFQFDITTTSISRHIPSHSIDSICLFFVLSSISPEKHEFVLNQLSQTVKVGGRLLFRDFCHGDLAESRFDSTQSKLSNRFYVRQDGTRSYFFIREHFIELVERLQWKVIRCEAVQRVILNRKSNREMNRIWLQAELAKME